MRSEASHTLGLARAGHVAEQKSEKSGVMSLDAYEADALSHAVAAMQAAVGERPLGDTARASQHALQVLQPMAGILNICREYLVGVCRPGAECAGCYFCRAVAPTLCTQCQAATKIVLCALSLDCSYRGLECPDGSAAVSAANWRVPAVQRSMTHRPSGRGSPRS